MMGCLELRPILSLFLEKETGPRETLEARRHLDTCQACRARADSISGLIKACDQLVPAAPTPDISGSVMARLRGLKAAALGSGSLLPAAKWSGLALLLCAGLAGLSRPGSALLEAMRRPLASLGAMLWGGVGEDAAGDMAGTAGGLLLRLADGDLGAQLSARAGLDIATSAQIALTAGGMILLLALPAAVVTVVLLRAGSR